MKPKRPMVRLELKLSAAAAANVRRGLHRVRVAKGERALRELELSVTTQADRDRIDRVWRALRALDDEQAALTTELEAKR